MLWPALAAALSQHWNPGIAAPDEIAVLGRCALLGQGIWPHPRITGGTFPLYLYMVFCHFIPANALLTQWIPSLGVALEGPLLFRVGDRLGGPRAGIAAAWINAGAAQTLLRARTLLGFNLLPLELLCLLLCSGKLRRPLGAFLWGLVLALFLFDYEAWPAAWPALMVLALAEGADRKRLVLGLGLGLAITLGASAGFLGGYVRQRAALGTFDSQGISARLFHSLGAYFLGSGGGSHELGPWPSFPLAALPLVLLGLKPGSRRVWLWLLALCGLLPLAASGNGIMEARRAIVAWPALCLLAGLGAASWTWRPAGFKTAAMALAAVLALAELSALHRGLDARDQATYALSRRAEAAAQALERADPGPKALWLDLSGTDHAWERWWLRSQPSSDLWALVPGAYALPSLLSRGGRWIRVAVPGAAPVFWLRPPDALKPELEAVEGAALDLQALRTGNDSADGPKLLQRSMERLPRETDPWIRTLLLETALESSMRMGGPAEDLLRKIEAGPLSSSNAPLSAAAWLAPKDPGRALKLMRRVTDMDPRRGRAWRLRSGLAARLGLFREAEACARRADAAEDW
jgi:hypothetical protein